MKKILSIILARGGSKGIKNKNIKKLGKIPLIAWTIKEALKSKKNLTVYLSTDSKKIASIGKKYGAEVPFIRPKKFAQDNSSSVDAIEHAINFLKKKGLTFDYVLLLEPTSPLRTHKDIDKSINKIMSNNYDSLVSVSKLESFHPSFLYNKNKKGFLSPFSKSKKKYIRRQDLETMYFLEGSIYISKITTLMKKRTFCHDKTVPFIMPKWKSIEIDDKLDLVMAEAIIKKKKLK
jgi:CMP-N,N'-diacetyllegionaminic acid synthase